VFVEEALWIYRASSLSAPGIRRPKAISTPRSASSISSQRFFLLYNLCNFCRVFGQDYTTTFVGATTTNPPPMERPTTTMMTHVEIKIKRLFGVLLPINAVGNGSIAGSPNSDTTHSIANSSNLSCNSVVPGLGNFEKVSRNLSNFRQVSALTFGTIGGVAWVHPILLHDQKGIAQFATAQEKIVGWTATFISAARTVQILPSS
jgi:hypothetical protein